MDKDVLKIIKHVAKHWTHDCEYAGRMENWCDYCGKYQDPAKHKEEHNKGCLSLKARAILKKLDKEGHEKSK